MLIVKVKVGKEIMFQASYKGISCIGESLSDAVTGTYQEYQASL